MWHDEPDRRRELRSERDGRMWQGARSISYVGDFVADSGFEPVPRDEAKPARGSEAALLAADPWQKLEAEKRTKTFMIERELPSARRLELSSLSGYAAGWRNWKIKGYEGFKRVDNFRPQLERALWEQSTASKAGKCRGIKVFAGARCIMSSKRVTDDDLYLSSEVKEIMNRDELTKALREMAEELAASMDEALAEQKKKEQEQEVFAESYEELSRYLGWAFERVASLDIHIVQRKRILSTFPTAGAVKSAESGCVRGQIPWTTAAGCRRRS